MCDYSHDVFVGRYVRMMERAYFLWHQLEADGISLHGSALAVGETLILMTPPLHPH